MEYKVIFHIDELNKWNLVLKNTSNLLEAIGNNKYYIEVVANAEAVKAYNSSNKETDLNLVNFFEELNNKGIKFVACNNALKTFNIKQEDLIDFVYVVPAGVLELVEKQMEGYAYIKP
ncbi:DsrE family protein [uncultured Clostridium sp.]|uniref:DsrE family protein n=1 Tax=uncultured Clostridium sp. TaxID=59620 RepID=UPI0028E53C36|nr:DsrE family protein [uncultured Clostridium sp.]